MSWPLEDRVAYYDAWLAAFVLALLAAAALALELSPRGEARAAADRIAVTMSSPEPPPGPDALPVLEVTRDARERLRAAAGRLELVARRLARPRASSAGPEDAGAPIRRRIRVDALRASMVGGSLALDDGPGALALAELVVARLGDAGVGPDRIRALRVATSPMAPVVDPIATRVTRTQLVLEVALSPRALGPALARLRENEPRLVLDRLAIAGVAHGDLAVRLELTQVEVTLGGEPALPRAHRDPEEGWIVDELPPGGRW